MRRPRWAHQAALRRLTTRHMTDIGCYINLHVVHSRGGVDFDTELGVELVALSGELLVGGGVALGLDPADEVVQLGDSGNVVALGEGGLHGVDGLLQGVAHVDLAGKGQVLLSVALGIGNHALDVDVGQASAVSLDVGLGLGASHLVHSSHGQDAVRVQGEGHLNLGLASLGALHTRDLELTKLVVGGGLGALTLVHDNVDLSLPVLASGVLAGLHAGDGGVAGDKGRHHLALKLDTEGEGGHIEQHQVGADALEGGSATDTAGSEDGTLHGGTVGDGLIGVDGLAQLDAAVEEGGQLLLEGRDAGGAADQHHVTDGVNGGASVAKHGLDGVNALGEVGLVELLEDGASDGHVEVLAVNEGIELNLGLVGIGEVSLGSLHSSAESLLRALTALHGLNLLKRPVDKGVVEVLTSEVGVATGGLHGEHTALHGQHTHIEGTTSKIEDDHVGSVLLGSTVNSRGVQTVGQGSGGGLVDDAHHL
eukprot:Colp12_sorted_trinity150504_noHs@20875